MHGSCTAHSEQQREANERQEKLRHESKTKVVSCDYVPNPTMNAISLFIHVCNVISQLQEAIRQSMSQLEITHAQHTEEYVFISTTV